MIKYNDIKQIILTDSFIREPVDIICKNINNNNAKKIILSGTRGCGKSIVLYNNELLGLGTDNQAINISFDAVGMNVLTPNKYFNEKFMIHYYEVMMSYKILNYIKKYYTLTYEKYFINYEFELKRFLEGIDKFIENSVYEKSFLRKYLNPGEISSKIIGMFKTKLGLNTLTLSIDRFDWTNSGIDKSQEVLSKYFAFFDRVVITTDDEKMNQEQNRNLLRQEGYEFINVDYGKDVEVVKAIIKKRIEIYNKNNMDRIYPIEKMTDSIYQNLIQKTGGNISLMFRIINQSNTLLRWKRKDFNMPKTLDSICDEYVKKEKEYRKMIKPPRLYL